MHKQIANKLKSANALIITAGAGMGIDSNLPDFRGANGFWNQYSSYKNKFSFTDCANPMFLEEHPNLFWGFYGHRLHLYRDTEPHGGFKILKSWCKGKKYNVITSNVDGHFTKAGFEADKVYEIHGSIHYVQCNSCRQIYSADRYNVKVDKEKFEAEDPLPQCKNCVNVTVRPNIVMFSDYSFLSDRVEEQGQQYQQFLRTINKEDKIVILEFGAGLAIRTIRMLSEQLFHTYKVNPHDPQKPFDWDNTKNTEHKAFISLKQNALEAITQINEHL